MLLGPGSAGTQKECKKFLCESLDSVPFLQHLFGPAIVAIRQDLLIIFCLFHLTSGVLKVGRARGRVNLKFTIDWSSWMAENNVPETPAASNSKYDEGMIRVLSDVEHVRTRPGMYIGGNNTKGLHHLIYEIVDNSIDEALAGFAKNILVKINADGSATIADDGRGIPVGIHPTEKIPTVEVVFATLGGRRKIRPQGWFALCHQRRAPRRGRLGRQFPVRMA